MEVSTHKTRNRHMSIDSLRFEDKIQLRAATQEIVISYKSYTVRLHRDRDIVSKNNNDDRHTYKYI